nr:hypothetical protein [uncultured Celeribacter sp.]
MRDHGFEERPIAGKTAALLLRCARVAMQGHDVAFVVHENTMVRYARDLCAAQVRPCAVGKSSLFYGSARLWICAAEAAHWRLRGWRGFAVLDHAIDPGRACADPIERRSLRDMRDIINMGFPVGAFEQLATVPVGR